MNTDSSVGFGKTGRAAHLPMRPRLRQLIGIFIAAAGALILIHDAYMSLTVHDPRMMSALTAGSIAALATALGTIPVLLSQQFSQRTYDSLLGFGAGVMLGAVSFSLVLPALSSARALGANAWSAGAIVGAGILLGAILIFLIDRFMPHEHFIKGVEGSHTRAVKRVWLFVLAITLHNLPEGLAIGVAYAGTDAGAARALATGISLQDVPEGLVVALALRGIGYGRWTSAGLGAVSGMIEPLAALAGVALIDFSAGMLPWGMAAAAGAMLYVISHEIIPESHRKGHEAFATAGLMLGFVVMTVLDTALA
jgi:ZIP family zinc transporter